jgi:hypothetical protein
VTQTAPTRAMSSVELSGQKRQLPTQESPIPTGVPGGPASPCLQSSIQAIGHSPVYPRLPMPSRLLSRTPSAACSQVKTMAQRLK